MSDPRFERYRAEWKYWRRVDVERMLFEYDNYEQEMRANALRYIHLRDHYQQTPDAYGQAAQLYFGTYAAGMLDAEIDADIRRKQS